MTLIRTAAPTPTTEDFRATADRLALRVADLTRDRDAAVDEAHDAIATGALLRDDLDTARAETADVREAAARLQQERDRLARDLRRATGEADGYRRIGLKLQAALDRDCRETRRLTDHVTRLARDNSRLQLDLDAAQQAQAGGRGRGWWRGRTDDHDINPGGRL